MSPHTPIGRIVLEIMADGKLRFIREVVAVAGLPRDAVREACKRLAARGLLGQENCGDVNVYRITDAGTAFLVRNEPMDGAGKGSLSSRHKDSLRARAWRLMRMRMWWSVSDLLMTLADGTEKDAEKGIKRYICALFRAGYLIASKREAERYHLVRNTGRLAPAFNTSARTLTDPNTGEVHDVRA